MAISRQTKESQVAAITDSLNSAKLTVFAHYPGLSVADIQQLRRGAREQGVAIKVVKNRLVRVAMQQADAFKKSDTSALEGQLLYAFSSEDETAPARALADFAKTHDSLKIAGGYNAEGDLMDADSIKALASLPSKENLIAQVMATLLSPVGDVTNGLSGNLHALLDGVEAKATS